ncbi:MAG: NYN domain-containing protein [Hyphomicrobiaceae bacterium]
MKRESSGPILTTVFVDYDNIYLSLKRKNEEAAKRFAKDSALWLQGILSGELITPTSSYLSNGERRLAMNRCYGNPVPRRNSNDNSTDMNSFPFIRHHFLKAGFEVIDCPPLTAQLKNSADIRIVMDIRDILTHDTFFDEFIILSGDADFTPVLHRLRAHARRTVVFANDSTVQPYTAISDGEIREASLIQLLTRPQGVAQITNARAEPNSRELTSPARSTPPVDIDAARRSILSEVVNFVRSAPQAVPMETLADRAVRFVGHDRTIGTQWAGHGTFRDLLLANLPDDIHLSDTPPYTVFDANRHINASGLIAPQLPPPTAEYRQEPEPRRSESRFGLGELAPSPQQRPFQPAPEARYEAPRTETHAPEVPRMAEAPRMEAPRQTVPSPAQSPYASAPLAQQPARRPPDALPPLSSRPVDPAFTARQQPLPGQSYTSQPSAPGAVPSHDERPAAQAPAPQAAPAEPRREPARAPAAQATSTPNAQRTADQATQIQQSIARIHEACQAPALAPAEYRVLFEVMAQELTANGLQGAQTLSNITQRAREFGLDLKRDDLRFILEVVSESDPWFEQGASANLFAGRFRNFVVARCRSQGLNLSADELDLVDAWFSSQSPQASRAPAYGRTSQPAAAPQQQPAGPQAAPAQRTDYPGQPQSDRWWSLEEGRQHIAEQRSQGSNLGAEQEDEFPRIVRSRLRG